MLNDEQMAAARLFHKEHPEAASALVSAIESVAAASREASDCATRIDAHLDRVLDRVSTLERRVAALEGLAGIGDLG